MSSLAKPPPPTVSIKGHFATKSSALATGNCKLESQFITAQNMASHYKRVINAKASIDINPPKSLVQSQKARDRAKREMVKFSKANKSLERAKSADFISESVRDDDISSPTETKSSKSKTATYRPTESARTLRIDQIKPRQLPDQFKLNQSMSNLMANFTKHSTNRVQTYRPASSARNDDNTHFKDSNMDTKNRDALNNLLFNARNLNSSTSIGPHPALKTMSKLVGNHNYDVLDNHSAKFKQPSKEFEPRIKNNPKSTSQLLQKSSCYQPPRRRKKKVSNSEQNNEQTTPLSTFRKSFEEKNDDVNESIIDETAIRKNTSGLNESNLLNTSSNSTGVKRTAEKEEEIKYLAFIKDVTDDVIARGITSNRVINNCFDFHIKKNRDRLDEKKMRELLNTLREDIGMSNEGDDLDIDTKYHKALNKAIYMDKEKDKENSDLTGGSQYLTLRKFGYTGSSAGKNGSQSNLNISSNDQDNEYRLAKLIEPTTTAQIKSSLKKKSSYDDYETQIIKNIQSIRRNSKGSNSSDNNDNNNTSLSSNKFVKSVNVSMNNNENEINSKSPSPQLIQNKRITLASTPLGPSKETNSNVTLDNNNENINSSKNLIKKDEDDDDEFVVASKLKLTDQSSEDEIKNKSKSPETLNKSNLSRKSNINESFNARNMQNEYSEDVLFNNDYGESDKNESEEEDEKNDGELSKQLLKTKTFNRNDFKKLNNNNQSSDSDGNEDEEEAKDKVQDIKPSVSPRKFTNQSSKKKFDFDQSDDDEF